MKRLPPLASAIVLLAAMAQGQGKTDHVGDVKFAVDAIEKECKTLLASKKIDWKKVTAPLVAEAKKTKTDEAHLLLLRRLLARLQDGHAAVVVPPGRDIKVDVPERSQGPGLTAGMASQETDIELPSKLFKLHVSVASNRARFQGGKGIEGVGVVPHEVVEFDPKDLAAQRDTLIARAEALLKAFPQGKVRYDPAKTGWGPKK